MGVASIGYSFDAAELSLYATYNLTNPYKDVEPSSYTVSHHLNSTPTTLNDYDCSQKFLANKYTVGLGLRFYFGGGFMKK